MRLHTVNHAFRHAFLTFKNENNTSIDAVSVVELNVFSVSAKSIVDGSLGLPGASQEEFAGSVHKRMMDYKKSVLNIVSAPCTLMVVKEINHLARVFNYRFSITAHRLRYHSALDIKINITINHNVVSLVARVGISLDIGIYIKKILVALRTFPQIPTAE